MPWTVSQASSIGGRDEQQDRIATFHTDGQDIHLLVLADGAGGHGNGALAAQALIDVAADRFSPGAAGEPERLIVDICRAAHRDIQRLPAGGARPPASTCVVLLLLSRDAYWTHLGDSRLYLMRGERVLLQTEDHSLARLDAEAGGDAPGGVPRRQIYLSLGASRDPSPAVESVRVEPGDRFLLCSDGFWGHVPIDEIARSLASSGLDEHTAREWVERANERGGGRGDNISLLIAQCLPDRPPTHPRLGASVREWIARLVARWSSRGAG